MPIDIAIDFNMIIKMTKDKEKNLYDDRFSSIMSWLHGGLVNLVIGGAISLFLALYVHVLLGALMALFTVVYSIAAYIVFKK